jgi:hypothetical protein
VATTGALLATATVTGVMALSKSNAYNDRSSPDYMNPTVRDSGQTLATTTDVLLILSAVSAGTTVFLYFKTDWGTVHATPSGVALAGRF